MKKTCSIILLLALSLGAAEPAVLLEDSFSELSSKWSSTLGTWTAKDGVLHGFESGKRRHGPSIHQALNLRSGVIEVDFRLNGKAEWASLGFNRGEGAGHLVAVLMRAKGLRVIAHPPNAEKTNAIDDDTPIAAGAWHHVRVEFKGEQLTVNVGEKTFTVVSPCFAETKATLGLGGNSGGPEGEKAGSLDFRKLKVLSLP